MTVRNYYDFVAWIKIVGMPAFISFDHDLAFEHYPFSDPNPTVTEIPYDSYKEKTGYHARIGHEKLQRMPQHLGVGRLPATRH